MAWYGLKQNKEIILVIPWHKLNQPTFFDFNWPLFGDIKYEIVEVTVAEVEY